MFDKIDNSIQNSLKSSIESMELIRLSSPPHVLSKLLDVCHDPDSSVAALADLINTDIVLTSKLIMAVNSTAFSHSQPLNDLQQAIRLLGHDCILH